MVTLSPVNEITLYFKVNVLIGEVEEINLEFSTPLHGDFECGAASGLNLPATYNSNKSAATALPQLTIPVVSNFVFHAINSKI